MERAEGRVLLGKGPRPEGVQCVSKGVARRILVWWVQCVWGEGEQNEIRLGRARLG